MTCRYPLPVQEHTLLLCFLEVLTPLGDLMLTELFLWDIHGTSFHHFSKEYFLTGVAVGGHVRFLVMESDHRVQQG